MCFRIPPGDGSGVEFVIRVIMEAGCGKGNIQETKTTIFNTAISPVNTAILRLNGGIELFFGVFCDTIQPNQGKMAMLKVEMEQLNENTEL